MFNNLAQAIYWALTNPEESQRSLGKQFNIHRSTIQRKVSIIQPLLDKNFTIRDIKIQLNVVSGRNIHKRKLNEEDEKKLVDIIEQKASEGTGLNSKQIRELAADFINKDSDSCLIFSKTWYSDFMNRHPDLSERKAQKLTIARAKSLTPEIVDDLFVQLKNLYDFHKFSADRIFNLDEKGFDGESSRINTVIAPKAQKHVNSTNCGFRDHWSLMAIVNAAGFCCPPLFVFLGKELPGDILANGPPNSKATVQENGYFTDVLFHQVLDHLIGNTSLIPRPILLLLDGSDTHLSREPLEYAKNNGVIIMKLPPQTTHRLQPLDISVFKPLSSYFQDSCRKFKKEKKRGINRYDLAEIVKPAWERATIPSTIISGFRNCGYWPLDRSKITKTDCAPSKYDFPTELKQCTFVNNSMNKNNNIPQTNGVIPSSTSQSIDMDIDSMDLNQLRTYSHELLKRNEELMNLKPKRRKTLQSCTAMLLTSDEILTKLAEQESNKKSKTRKGKRGKSQVPILATSPKKIYQIKTNIQTPNNEFKLILTKL
jgi:hypothetical protein